MDTVIFNWVSGWRLCIDEVMRHQGACEEGDCGILTPGSPKASDYSEGGSMHLILLHWADGTIRGRREGGGCEETQEQRGEDT